MLYRNLPDIDFNKYNRFFSIGCSFTQWNWPTWAHVIHQQYPHLELHNLAKGGQGNLYISTILSQIDLKYNLCETDLVAIMWSTFHRTDYYQSADIVDLMTSQPAFVKQVWNWKSLSDLIGLAHEDNPHISDDRGHLIRDCGIIHNCTQVLEHAAYDSFQMFSVPPDKQTDYDGSVNTFKQDVLDLYSGLSNHMVGEALSSFLDDQWLVGQFSLIPAHLESGAELDKHPTTSQYTQYLQSLGFTVSEDTQHWARDCDERVRAADHALELQTIAEWAYGGTQLQLPL